MQHCQQENNMNNIGNNTECLKTFRTIVRLFENASIGTTNTFGRYYFDEIRELVGKNIVGFNIDLNSQFGFLPGNIPNNDYTLSAQGIPYTYASKFELDKYFLNFYNDKEELILENFPCLLATNLNINSGNNSTPTPGKKRVYSLNTKIDIRKCFIFGQALSNFSNLVISVNFYYK